MADALVEGAAKLQLDEETGEMVSKSELKKRMAKRAKKAKVAAIQASGAASEKKEKAPVATTAPKDKPDEIVLDPEAMFKQGFLEDVFVERPMKPVITRFPPEPNGYLHIGHAKAIAVNFGFAKYHGGVCYLRYDDTNPEAEEEKYFTAIEDMVRWLGFTPYKITYSSDNFGKLYDNAEKLIGLGKAYVCHCDDAAIKAQRGGEERGPRFRCEHADQTAEENLRKFRAMRDGGYKPREAFLRMKQDIDDGNPQMWDLAAYRVLEATHHRTGAEWRIYPTYDFTHCLCDSFEGITHSLCTTEFTQSRVSYEWLNKELGVYEPMQREYGRLSLQGTLLSKRKIMKMVTEGIVRGWDDPRLYTLIGIKRRGIPPGAILEFVNELGITTSASLIQIARFEQSVRKYLERTVPRLMMVLDPLEVLVEGEGAEEMDLPDVAFSPKVPAMGARTLKFTPRVYIDASDFRETDSKDYFRLAPGKTVGLLHVPWPIKAVSYAKDESTGKVTQVRAVFDKSGKKVKTYIQWVSAEDPHSRPVEARVHNQLFKSERPEDAPGGFLNDVNPDSEVVHPLARIEAAGFDEVRRRAPWPEVAGEAAAAEGADKKAVGPESVRFQAMRIAYFAMDKDSDEAEGGKVVLNRIVSLKEDAGKS